METAVTYERISTTEQSRHSLSGQRLANIEHCERNGWHVAASFSDESTGSNFDRPGWQSMLGHIKKHRPAFVVVMKYDRLSRNASESLGEIERIEKKYGCRFVSVTEALPVSEHSPYFFKMRADLFVNAEFELKIIRDRTLFGRVNAAKSGRFAGPAPFGYDNGVGPDKKPCLVLNVGEAAIVAQMYADFAAGRTFAEVLAVAKPAGFPYRHNEAVKRVLKNPIYCGKVVVPPYCGVGAYIANGTHPAIVDEATYWRVQDLMSKDKPKKHQAIEDVYLRGVLYCEVCGMLMTSSKSRGNGGVYNYYFCGRHKGKSYRVERVHTDLDTILKGLSFDSETLSVLQQFAREEMRAQVKGMADEAAALKKRIGELSAQIESVEEKLIQNVVNKEVYDKWKPRLEAERSECLDRLKLAEKADTDIWAEFEAGLADLGKLDLVFASSDVQAKQEILGLIFGENLTKVENGFRTDYVMPFFMYKALQISQLDIIKTEEPDPNCEPGSVRTPYGNNLEPIAALMSLFSHRKRFLKKLA